jgi:hypothetical protein
VAAVTALRLRNEGGPALCGQLLLHPVTDYHTPAAEGHEDQFPARYRSVPLLVFIHGSGFVLCSLDTHDGMCRNVDEDDLPDRGEGQQGSAASAPQLLADDTGPDGDQSPAATRVTLRPHDPATGEEIVKIEPPRCK